MKLALCLLNGRIAPRCFDAAEFLMVTIRKGDTITNKKAIAVAALDPQELCTLVEHLKPNLMICGGVREEFQQKLKKNNIKLIHNVIGNVDDVVNRYMEGTLCSGDIVK